jgi:hypothetical protein
MSSSTFWRTVPSSPSKWPPSLSTLANAASPSLTITTGKDLPYAPEELHHPPKICSKEFHCVLFHKIIHRDNLAHQFQSPQSEKGEPE